MTSENSSPLRLGYLVNQYPMVSHSFIRREIQALEKSGVEVIRFSLRGWDSEIVDHRDKEEQKKTRYTLRDGLPAILISMVRCAVQRPGPFWRALKSTVTMSKNAVRPWPYHLIYLAHACHILLWLKETPITHMHAHFGTNSAEIAVLLHLLGGPECSFTVHGTEVADEAKRNAFNEKLEHARFVVAISAYTGSQLMRHVNPKYWPKVNIVHCGLPVSAFAKKPAPFPKSPTFLSIGRLSEEKGQLLLLDAFSKVRANHPSARLVIAGDGHMRPNLEQRIAELKLGPSVRITGWITSDQVRTEIQGCHVLVQPSFSEGLPVVIMEAMGQHRPIISTFIGGIPELVQPGKTGWLVPAGDIDALSDAMVQSVEMSPANLRSLGKQGFARVKQRHSVETEAEKLKALFFDGV